MRDKKGTNKLVAVPTVDCKATPAKNNSILVPEVSSIQPFSYLTVTDIEIRGILKTAESTKDPKCSATNTIATGNGKLTKNNASQNLQTSSSNNKQNHLSRIKKQIVSKHKEQKSETIGKTSNKCKGKSNHDYTKLRISKNATVSEQQRLVNNSELQQLNELDNLMFDELPCVAITSDMSNNFKDNKDCIIKNTDEIAKHSKPKCDHSDVGKPLKYLDIQKFSTNIGLSSESCLRDNQSNLQFKETKYCHDCIGNTDKPTPKDLHKNTDASTIQISESLLQTDAIKQCLSNNPTKSINETSILKYIAYELANNKMNATDEQTVAPTSKILFNVRLPKTDMPNKNEAVNKFCITEQACQKSNENDKYSDINKDSQINLPKMCLNKRLVKSATIKPSQDLMGNFNFKDNPSILDEHSCDLKSAVDPDGFDNVASASYSHANYDSTDKNVNKNTFIVKENAIEKSMSISNCDDVIITPFTECVSIQKSNFPVAASVEHNSKPKYKQLLSSLSLKNFLNKKITHKNSNNMCEIKQLGKINSSDLLTTLDENGKLLQVKNMTGRTMDNMLEEFNICDEQDGLKDKLEQIASFLSPELKIEKINVGEHYSNISLKTQNLIKYSHDNPNSMLKNLNFVSSSSEIIKPPKCDDSIVPKDGLQKGLNLVKNLVNKITGKRKDNPEACESYLSKRKKMEPREAAEMFMETTGTLFNFPGPEKTTDSARFADIDSSPGLFRKRSKKPLVKQPYVQNHNFIDNTQFDDVSKNSIKEESLQLEPLDSYLKSDTHSSSTVDLTMDSTANSVNGTDERHVECNFSSNSEEKQYLLDKFLETMADEDGHLSSWNHNIDGESMLRDLSGNTTEQQSVMNLSKSTGLGISDSHLKLQSSSSFDTSDLEASECLPSLPFSNRFSALQETLNSLGSQQLVHNFGSGNFCTSTTSNTADRSHVRDQHPSEVNSTNKSSFDTESQSTNVNIQTPTLSSIMNYMKHIENNLIEERLVQQKNQDTIQESLKYLMSVIKARKFEAQNLNPMTTAVDLYILRQIQKLHGIENPTSVNSIFETQPTILKDSFDNISCNRTADLNYEINGEGSFHPSMLCGKNFGYSLSNSDDITSQPIHALNCLETFFESQNSKFQINHPVHSLPKQLAPLYSEPNIGSILNYDSAASIHIPSESYNPSESFDVASSSNLQVWHSLSPLPSSASVASSVPVSHKPPVHPASIAQQKEIANLVAMWKCRPLSALTSEMNSHELPVTLAQLSFRKHASIYLPTAQERTHFKVG